ncbi:MAG: hypothetical protein H7062_10470 [Candidatus Saccharimonas sp.]|nr:hypothetical protein [Planctomycetaceae bacterium]
MARLESDREDLMAEAVALVRRVELRTPGRNGTVVVGFRTNGWLSIYLGPDPMYQFDELGRLRRAFMDGLLYRTQGTTLAQLRRERTDVETTLLRRDLTEPELAEFRSAMLSAVASLHEHLVQRQAVLVRQSSAADDHLLDELATGLDRVLKSPEFLAPPIPGKR